MRRILMVLVLLTVGVGCGDESGGGGESVELGDSLLDLLRAVPDTEDNRNETVYYGNFDRLRDGDDPSSLDDDVTLLAERSSDAMSLPFVIRSASELPEFAEFTGFDTRDVDAFLDFGAAPDGVSALIGDFDTDDLESGLRLSPGGGELATETVDGVTIFSLGSEEERFDPEVASPIRPTGGPLRIAASGRALYWAQGRAHLEACLAALDDTTTSLADDVAYVSVATVLDGAAVVNALLLTPSDGQDWTLAGVGESFQGETSTLTIVLQYPDAARAAAAVATLGAMVETGQSDVSGVVWSDFLTATDIHSEGSLMIATITSLSPGVAYDIVFRQENLLQV